MEEKKDLSEEKERPPAYSDQSSNINGRSTYTLEDAVEAGGFGRFQIKLFVICGILTGADAIEMLLLSVLGPALRCFWFLSSNQVAAITTVVFVGFLFGAPFWGFISDRYGRWPTLFTVLSMIAYFGVLTCFSPNYPWIIILRMLVGFAMGGASGSFTLLSEFLSVRHRARVLIAYNIFWAIGSLLEVGLAFLILPRYGWRWLVFASALPVISFLTVMKFLPESPRYLVGAGRIQEAEAILQSLMRSNGVEPFTGQLVSKTVPVSHRGSLKLLFDRNYASTTLMLPFIWFTAAFCYYGVVLISAEIVQFQHNCYSYYVTRGSDVNATKQIEKLLDNSCCSEMTTDDFLSMLVSTVGEFINIPVMMIMVDCIGRKRTLGIWYLLTSVLFILLSVCMPTTLLTVVLFVLRALTTGLFSLNFVYATEVYPTTVRAIAVGTLSSIARLGAMITPYVAQVMLPDVSQLGALCLYCAFSLISSILSFLLPIETKGRELPHTVDNVNESQQ